MTELNDDVLLYIFQVLYYLITNNEIKYKKSLHSCLFVNKHWYAIMIPILWRYPSKFVYKNESLFNIIISHLSDNLIKFLKDKNIIEANFQKQKLLFNYVKFCQYLNDIYKCFPKRSSSLLDEEIYKLFISECSSIKRLCSEMLSYPIYKYPGSNISLSNLSELRLVSSSSYNDFYHELAQICRSIEKIYIKLCDDLSGNAELIEMQKQIKYIYVEESYMNCEKIEQALEKHANSIVSFNIKTHKHFLNDTLLPKLINLQQLGIVDNFYELKHGISYLNYYELQILELVNVLLDIAIDIIQNTNGNLWKIKIRPKDFNQVKEYNQTIHKHCPNIKYVSLFLKDDETLKELEKIFIKCQHLVAIDISNIPVELHDKFLDLLVKLAPHTLYKFHIGNIDSFNIKSLKLFFNDWSYRGRKPLYLYHRERFIGVKEIIRLNYYSDDFWLYGNTWTDI
ncbi:hypothetical protein RhiirB3_440302 [Rhizophagus irregularis]|nr:hypothetical protein RhiirB3_440302 [Rhizophagus irregularis]